MAKLHHVRLGPAEARPIQRLAKRTEWSFNKAAKKLLHLGAQRHPLLRGRGK